jgi:hypothetical protein
VCRTNSRVAAIRACFQSDMNPITTHLATTPRSPFGKSSPSSLRRSQAEIAGHARVVGRTTISLTFTSGGCSMAEAMARFCKATSMIPCCRGAEHAASRRGRIRIIAMPTVEDVVVAVSEVVVAVSIEPRRCGRARKHGRGREYQKSKFPCHDRGSSALTSEETIDQSAACSKRRIRKWGCAFDVRANLARVSEGVVRRVADVRVGQSRRFDSWSVASSLPPNCRRVAAPH